MHSTPYLMFCGPHAGEAEAAITLYTSLIPNSRIVSMERHAAGSHEPEGMVRLTRFTLAGRDYMALDSAAGHAFTFTPAFSIFLDCDDEAQIDRLHAALREGGQELMPLGNYGFSKKFCWLNDRFGVSWQINLPHADTPSSARDVALAKTAMLIRNPVHRVFEAFVNPEITTKFWFTHGSGRLETGKTVRWDWQMYNVGDDVTCIDLVQNERLEIEWNGASGRTRVVWTFTPLDENSTYVEINNHGFQGDTASLFAEVVDSTGGFTMVLAGAKAWLEYGLMLNLTADAHPAGLQR